MNTTELEQFLNTKLGSISLGHFLLAVLICIVGYILVNILTKLFEKLMANSNIDDKVLKIISRIFRTGMMTVVLVIAVNTLGIDTSFLTAVIIVITLCVAVIVKSIAENIASGASIRNAKSFIIGDYIEVGNVQGEVIEHTLSYTKILNVDGVVAIIPNKNIGNSTILNYTTKDGRPIVIKVSVEYKNNIDEILSALRGALYSVDNVLDTFPKEVELDSLGQMGMDFKIKCYTKKENYEKVMSDLNIAIVKDFNAHGITFAQNRFGMGMFGKTDDKSAISSNENNTNSLDLSKMRSVINEKIK